MRKDGGAVGPSGHSFLQVMSPFMLARTAAMPVLHEANAASYNEIPISIDRPFPSRRTNVPFARFPPSSHPARRHVELAEQRL
jgi:hypothetical protein